MLRGHAASYRFALISKVYMHILSGKARPKSLYGLRRKISEVVNCALDQFFEGKDIKTKPQPKRSRDEYINNGQILFELEEHIIG